jgi:hypothetical protein
MLLETDPQLSIEAALVDLAVRKRGLWLACPDILFFTRSIIRVHATSLQPLVDLAVRKSLP